jgi:drug/metabolite transporter (DMT)-like permease
MNPAYLVALLSCVLFGTADLAGGVAAKRASAPLVTWISSFGALAVLLVGLPFTPGRPTAADLAWGAAGGAGGAIGASLIYRSLARGPAVVASPVFCLVGLTVPVAFGLALGERPDHLRRDAPRVRRLNPSWRSCRAIRGGRPGSTSRVRRPRSRATGSSRAPPASHR